MKRWPIALLLLAIPAIALANWMYLPGPGYSRGGGGSTSSCMAGAYTIGWDGSDTVNACDAAHNVLLGSMIGTVDIGTSYGDGGQDVAAKFNTSAEYISYADSSGSKVDINGAQTVWMRIYVSQVPSGNTQLAYFDGDGGNNIIIDMTSEPKIRGRHRIESAMDTVYSASTFTVGSFIDIAYSWDRSARDHAISVNGSWSENLNSISAVDSTVDVATINIGPMWDFSMPANQYFVVTKFAVVSGYKTAIPW